MNILNDKYLKSYSLYNGKILVFFNRILTIALKITNRSHLFIKDRNFQFLRYFYTEFLSSNTCH